MLLAGYRKLKSTGGDFAVFDENDLTVQLVGRMKKDPMAVQYRISIARESYEDDEEAYAGRKKADQSPRVDIKYITWGSASEYAYRMEAKNLALKNYSKPGNKKPVSALALRQRYIATGIANFVDGTYGDGCLLGYIRQGQTAPIVEELNKLLLSAGRDMEQLRQENSFSFEDEYGSRHDPPGLVLKHFFLDFCTSGSSEVGMG